MAEHGYGSTLTIGTDTIGEMTNISIGGQSRDSIDTSSMDSANKFREFLPGMIDAGEITAELTFNGLTAAEATVLQGKLTATVEAITITFGDTTANFSCSGFVSNVGAAMDYEGKISQSVTIKLTGAPVLAGE